MKADPDRWVVIDRASSVSIRRQLVDQVIEAVQAGRLEGGQLLPSSRMLAARLGIARSTVVSSYLELEGEGWLDPVAGAGTFVTRRCLTATASPEAGVAAPGLAPGREAGAVHAVPRFDLRTGRVDPTLVNSRAWRTAWHQVEPSSYSPPACGEPALIHELADRLRWARDINASPEEIVVCAGIGEALIMLTLALGWIGRTVVVEDPCYWQVRATLTRLGVAVRPLDAGDPAAFVRSLQSMSPPPEAVYLTPNHQYPLGHRLHDTHRAELLDWAARSGCLLIEDDYNSEFRFSGPGPDTLSSRRTPAQVVYFATMSKILDPGLRLAYLRLPPGTVEQVRAARIDMGATTSRPTQLVVARLLRSGEVSRQVARLRRIYGDRRAALLRGLADVPTIHDLRGTETGLHVVAHLDSALDAAAIVASAADRGVLVNDLDDYRAAPHHDQPAIVLGFAQLTPADLRAAIAVLRDLPEAQPLDQQRGPGHHRGM